MKFVILFITLAFSVVSAADLRPVDKWGNTLYHKDYLRIEENRIYQVSGQTGLVQYHKESYIVQNGRVYAVSPNGIIDYSKTLQYKK